MTERPKYLTLAFWTAVLSGAGVIAVALGLLPQETADAWQAMLLAFVAAVLPVIALITGWSNERAARASLLAEDVPPWLTAEFWMTIVTTVVMVLIAAGVLTTEQGEQWKLALGPLVAALLTIAAYVRGRLAVQTNRTAALLSSR